MMLTQPWLLDMVWKPHRRRGGTGREARGGVPRWGVSVGMQGLHASSSGYGSPRMASMCGTGKGSPYGGLARNFVSRHGRRLVW